MLTICLLNHVSPSDILKDEFNVLVNAQEHKNNAMRQMRFESKSDINDATVLAYLKEAVENQRLGKELKPLLKTKAIIIPEELKIKLKANTALNISFKA